MHYVDIGTSGGVAGEERGYCLMIGGEPEAVERLRPIFARSRRARTASRTPGTRGEATTAEQGYLHCGPAGAGHFVKMVHNGIEYGLMAAYAEGLNILKHADVGRRAHAPDAGRRRCAIPTTIATSSICRPSPRSGAAAAS